MKGIARQRRRSGPAKLTPAQATSTQTSVLDLIHRHVRTDPGAIAVEDGERTLTYGELDSLASRVAAVLRRRGTLPDSVVGIFAWPRWQTVVGILGILKAGGAYLPLDTRQPWPRTETMLAECEVAVLLGMQSCPALADAWQERYVSLEDPHSLPPEAWQPDGLEDGTRLAYVLYTSGTTGRPNGVLVTHDNLRYSTEARLSYYKEPVKRFCLLSPLTFDSSVAGLFWTLSTGGTIVLPYPDLDQQLSRVTHMIAERRISHVLCVPALWKSALSRNQPARWATHLTTTIVAGEACPTDLVRDHFLRCPNTNLFNEYGPTEATVWSTVHRVEQHDVESVPIGHTIPGMKAYVLNDDLQPVVEGSIGQLYLAGHGVARGYLNRPELTASRFMQNPLEDGDFGRMYRTGDLVRRDECQRLLFCGRVDHQIKVRGRRIEPEEIERVLLRQGSVEEAVVVCSHQRLTAYVVPRDGIRCESGTLRSHVAEFLPDYMVPDDFHMLSTLPRTRHGKIDRQSLAHRHTQAGPHPLTPPAIELVRDCVELDLLRTCGQVLRRTELSLQDNFFKAGGDSLATAELLARIEQQFGRQLSLAELVALPDLEALANHLRRELAPENWSPLVTLKSDGHRTPLFIVHPGGGNVLCYLALARNLGADRPLYGLQAPGVDGIRAPLETVDEMAEEYLDAIVNVQGEGPYALAGWSFGGLVAYEMACKLAKKGQAVDFLGVIDAAILYSVQVIRNLFPADVPLFHLLGLDQDILMPHFRVRAETAGLIPPRASAQQAQRILRVFRANARATIEYRPEPYAGRMTLLAATDAVNRRKTNPLKEWRSLCDDIVVEAIDGGHLSLLNADNLGKLATAMRRHLDQVV